LAGFVLIAVTLRVGTAFGQTNGYPGQQNTNASSGQQQDINAPTALQGVDGQQDQNPRLPDNTQVYIDSAGSIWNRTTSSTDRNQATFAPDPVTDLEKLARSSTGETLPVFGRDLFQRVPSTFAPANEVPVTPDYVVGPGDEVLVRTWGSSQASSNNQLTVDTAGNIYIPRVGAVQVGGLRANELQDRISTEVNRVFKNYRMSVSLGHLRSIQIYVVGEARKPGAYTVSALSTILNALFAAGGPNIQGSMRRIQLRRAGNVVAELDLYDLILHGDKSHDVRLQTGDTLFIPAVGPQVALAGSVRHAAVYELKDDAAAKSSTSLQDLITLAGGFSSTANPHQIRLERIDGDLKRIALSVNLDAAGLALALHDGDILYANHIETGFQKTVTIRGNLANPGRFAWHPGMRLSEILPDREALLTGDYWRERNRMGVPTPLFEPYEFNTPPPTNGGVHLDPSLMRNDTQAPGTSGSARDALTAVLPPSVPGQETQQQASLAVSGVVSNSATTLDRNAMSEASTIRTNNSGSVATNNNLGLNNGIGSGTGNNVGNNTGGEVPTSPISNGTNGVNTRQNGNSSVVPNDPVTRHEQLVTATRVATVIRLPAPEIDWSYAVIERLDKKTLKTSLVPFNLGRLVQDHDPEQNLELQAGDVVTILNQRDILVPQHEQTKFVRLEGEFNGAGIYSVNPGETLADLIRRSGGLTPNAYLYGSSFQRESTRAFQQERLDEYITQLSADMDRQTAVRGASTSSGVSDPNGLVLERNLVEQLKQLRATGRIVLEFNPDSTASARIPSIPLENGDVFRVPSRANTVNVIGAVYGQNVFLYDGKRRLADYISLAGLPTRNADKDHAFIIRADGSVYSRQRAKGVLSNHFDDSHIYPGDSIVIPEKPIKADMTRRLLDYAQILSAFGLPLALILQ
jgi:protein involved in polysaccharide export with SLBB domain